MPDIRPFLTLHASQIRDIAASIEVDDSAPRKADPRDRDAALAACRDARIDIPKRGYFTLTEVDSALDAAFDKSPLPAASKNLRRMELKQKLFAGGVLAEPSPVNKIAIVTAGLMLRKAGIPAPDGRPYTVAEFDALLACKAHISIPHRLEIKGACVVAGIVDPGVVAKPSLKPQAIHAAKAICDSLGLDFPEGGKKLKIADVDDAIERRDWNTERAVNAKSMLAAASAL